MRLLLLLVACSGAPDDAPTVAQPPDTESSDPTQPVDDGPVDVDIPSPSWDADEVAVQLAAAFASGMPDPFSPRDTYVDFFTHADEDCPNSEQPYHLPGDYEACTTADGTVFFGHGEYQVDIDAEATDSFYLLGDFYMLDQDDARFDGAGEVLYTNVPLETGDADLIFDLFMSGTWGYEAATDWMSEPTSLVLWSYGIWARGAAIGTFDGTLTIGEHALFLQDLSFDTGTCSDGTPVRGSMALRDPSGYWYDLSFPGSCDPCATVTWADGTELGEACVDFSFTPTDLLSRLASSDGTLSLDE